MKYKCKQILHFCFREPFSGKIQWLSMLFCYILAEFGMFLSITPTPKTVSLLFGTLYALVLTGICLSLPKGAGIVFFAISNFAITAWAMAQIIYSFLLELALMDFKFRKQVANFSYIATNPRPQGRGFLVFTEAAPAVLHSPVLFVLSERKSAEAAGECLLRG